MGSTHTARGTLRLRLRLIPTTDTDTTDWDTLVSDTVVSDTLVSDTLVSDTMVLDTMPTERERLMLMLRPMPLSFTPDTISLLRIRRSRIRRTRICPPRCCCCSRCCCRCSRCCCSRRHRPQRRSRNRGSAQPRARCGSHRVRSRRALQPYRSVHQLPGRAGVLLGSPVVATACVVKKVT